MTTMTLLAGLALATPLYANDTGDGHGVSHGAGTTLEGSEWRAVLVGETPLITDDGVTIAFAEGRVAGNSGCNRFTGGYEASASGVDDLAAPLAFGPLAGTRMACPGRGDEIESQVLPALERVDGFVLDRQGRLLLLSGTEVVLVAVPG